MKLRQIFGRRSLEAAASEAADVVSPPIAELDLDTLDECVGGRAESEDVSCYAQSTQSRVH